MLLVIKERWCKECSDYHTTALISHTSTVMLKILQARLQQCVNHELPDVQAGFRKGRETRDQTANMLWIIKKKKKRERESSRKMSTSAFDYIKGFVCVDHSKLWKILKEMGIPDHFTCLLKNLYAGKEASQNRTWNNGLVQIWERSTSRWYIITLT